MCADYWQTWRLGDLNHADKCRLLTTEFSVRVSQLFKYGSGASEFLRYPMNGGTMGLPMSPGVINTEFGVCAWGYNLSA
jgi:hypothetical protein